MSFKATPMIRRPRQRVPFASTRFDTRPWFHPSCARCGLPGAVQRSLTIGGATRRATVECNGLGVSQKGVPFITRCATPLTVERFNRITAGA